MKLVCCSGEVEVNIGDKFTDEDGEWEIIGFHGGSNYSPSALGGTAIDAPPPVSIREAEMREAALEWESMMSFVAAESKR